MITPQKTICTFFLTLYSAHWFLPCLFPSIFLDLNKIILVKALIIYDISLLFSNLILLYAHLPPSLSTLTFLVTISGIYSSSLLFISFMKLPNNFILFTAAMLVQKSFLFFSFERNGWSYVTFNGPLGDDSKKKKKS